MQTVDWDNAPEGTTHAVLGNDDIAPDFLMKANGHFRIYNGDRGWGNMIDSHRIEEYCESCSDLHLIKKP